jgi:hypothetical protein
MEGRNAHNTSHYLVPDDNNNHSFRCQNIRAVAFKAIPEAWNHKKSQEESNWGRSMDCQTNINFEYARQAIT